MDGSTPGSGAIAGIDVGGTFTDLVLVEPATGAMRLAKVPTTPANEAEGVLAALEAAAAEYAALDLIIHGTTTTTNAVLERRLAKTGLITTEGFRDVLELGRRTRPQPYGMTGSFTPVIPRDLRLEVPERMDATGAERPRLCGHRRLVERGQHRARR
ncbi:MAG: hydantoinase/oxoprolinase N-terminal domain-containing protein, partial [Pseudomonadota bacterium]